MRLPSHSRGSSHLTVNAPADPIKSCAAQPLPLSTPWPLTPTGLLYDREFMLVSASTGRALSMKRYTRMALIRPSIDRERRVLRVEAAGMEPLEVPLSDRKASELGACGLPTPPLSEDGHTFSDDGHFALGTEQGATPRSTTLCSTTVLSQRFSSSADAWFTAFLNPPSTPCTGPGAGPGPVELHRLPPGSSRHAHFDGADASPPLPLRLSNESPFLLVSGESLRAVAGTIRARARAREGEGTAGRDKTPQEVVRAAAFRPNLVVEGEEEGALQPWWEDGIEALSVGTSAEGGGGVFSFLGRCRRCLMVSVDQVRLRLLSLPVSSELPLLISPHAQTTGARTAEPLATLSLTRRNASNGRVEFGAHMLWRDELGGGRREEGESGEAPCVKVGDEVRVRLRA